VREPERTIPRAIVACLAASALVYALVTAVALGALGAEPLAQAARAAGTPLEAAAQALGSTWLVWLVRGAAVTAMLGIALNLLLGLSRVLLAMARRGDMPRVFSRLTGEPASPRHAIAAVAVLVALLALSGDVKLTWSFSAFSVLVYYAITNLAALRLPAEARRVPRSVAAAGLAACLGLAFWVEPRAWGAGTALVALGLVWHALARRRAARAR
jgi:basic amino acid/polyamine antiporter, APA family